MRIAIVGAGAIGCLFGFRLYQSGHDVLLIHHRPSVVRTLNKTGVTLRELSGHVSKAQIKAKHSLSEKDDLDLALLTVKSYDTKSAALLLRSWKVRPSLGVLSLQNGLGNIEALSRYLVGSLALAGSTTEGVLQTSPGKISHTGIGSTWIGEPRSHFSQRCTIINRILRRAGFKNEVSDHVQGVIWSKAIVNSAINPVSALTGAKNGDILVVPSLRNLTEKVVEEGVSVSTAIGIRLKPDPRRLLTTTLRLASANKSSMLQDIEMGKRTEIHQLNGHIVKEGHRFRLPTPYNELLLKLVSGMEALNRKP